MGSTLPIITAPGQLFLAHLTDERSLARATGHLAETERAALLERRAAAQLNGIAFSDASADGLRCVAAPIYGPDGALAATLALMGTIHRMPGDAGDPRVVALVRAAQSLSTR